MQAIKYPSTGQFRNAVKYLQHNAKGTIQLNGTVKLHGTNGSVVKLADGTIFCQSKSRILDRHNDNFGFANYMLDQDLEALFESVELSYSIINGEAPPYPIEIAGEWAGQGIQKGVAIGEVERFFAIFGIRFGDGEDAGGHLTGWVPIVDYSFISMRDQRIFNICDFGVVSVNIDLSMPALISPKLQEITEGVEAECPAGSYFGVKGVGEGIVWQPDEPDLVTNPQSWFKVKGQKHSVSKVKTLAPVDVEELKNIQAFVDYAVTENRLNQGLQEVGLDQTKIGVFIGWINKDVLKEEADTLEANGLTMKQVGRLMSQKAREFYMAQL